MASTRLPRILLSLLLGVCYLGIIPYECEGSPKDYYCSWRVVGYYPDYHAWRLPINEIPFDSLTHIIYFSIAPEADGSLNQTQINEVRQDELISTAHAYQVVPLICVGGWGLSQHFSAVAANTATRQTFISNLVQYCLANDFGGVDLDWEPVVTQADRDNYVQLITELSLALSPHDRSLSVAVMALGQELDATAADHLDWLNVMAYDMGTPHSAYEDALAALAHWKNRGFRSEQEVLGVPFYGRASDGSYMLYRDIMATYNPDPHIDEVAGIDFNGPATVDDKTTYIIKNDYGGVAIWELSGDTDDSSSLLLTISNALLREKPPDFNCDQIFDMVDLSHFASHWLFEPCVSTNSWCASCDANQSGKVDFEDWTSLCRSWLSN